MGHWSKRKKGTTINITIINGNVIYQHAEKSGQIIKIIADANKGGQNAFFGASNTKRDKVTQVKKVYTKPKRYPSFKKGMFV